MAQMTIDERYIRFCGHLAGLTRCVQTIKTIALKEFHLKGSSVNCVFYLNQHPDGLTITELSELCQEDKAAISRNMTILEDRGFAIMVSENGKRYRARFVLTDSGRAAASRLHETIVSSVEAGGSTLTDDDRSVFYRCLSAINKNLQGYITMQETKSGS